MTRAGSGVRGASGVLALLLSSWSATTWADQITVTYSFATTAESWAGNGGTSTTNTYQAGIGNAAGDLESSITGTNKNDAVAGWVLSGVTWQTLGVPSGATVTSVDGRYDWQCSTYTLGDPASASGDLTVTDSVDANSTTLETGVTFAGTTAFATRNASGAVNMPAALGPSGTSIKIKLIGVLKTPTGPGSPKTVTRQMDNVVLVINYTPARHRLIVIQR